MDSQINPFATLSFIVAPAILTNASSILTLSTGNRLARAVDRARQLTSELEYPNDLADAVAQSKLQELSASQRRMLMLIRALRAFYVALGGFASAALLSLVGAVLATTAPPSLLLAAEGLAAFAGVVAVAGLVRGALLLVRETRIAVGLLEERAFRVQAEFEQRRAEWAGKSPSRPEG